MEKGFWGIAMSALGQKQTFAVQNGMSALPPKADICSALAQVRFGPKSGLMQRSKNDRYSITLVGAGELLFGKNGLIRDPITAISRRRGKVSVE